MCGKNFFNLWCSHSQKIIESMLFHSCPVPHSKLLHSCPVPHSKLQVEFFEDLFPQSQKGLEETMICSVKIQSENRKMTWNISLFPFGTIAIFLNVMTLQFCNQYQIVWY